MRAHARLAVARRAGDPAATCVTRLRSEPPMVLRPTGPTGHDALRRWQLRDRAHAHVALATAAAGPLGGDHLRLDVDVGAAATLVVRSVAATLLLPGPHGDSSHTEIAIDVGEGATLVWLPGPLIAARGCDHHQLTRIDLAPTARLMVVEELILGRHGEAAGAVHQRLQVRRGDRPLLDQELCLGPGATGWDGPAVTGGRRALGCTLLVDPGEDGEAFTRPAARADVTTARLTLDGPAVLVTALAPDLPSLRHRMRTSLGDLDEQAPARQLSPIPGTGSGAPP